MNFLRRFLGLSVLRPPAQPVLPVIQLQRRRGYTLQVVGESYYQHNLERICGPRKPNGENRVVAARLVLDDKNPHDDQAVRVEINGLQVGHLSREDARAYRQHLLKLAQAAVIGECEAKIKGGWKRGRNDVGHYGVTLNAKIAG